MKEFEAVFQSFRRPDAVDPSETVIRVYDADGKHYEERKVRFSAIPRDFVLNANRDGKRTASYTALSEAEDAARAAARSTGLVTNEFDPRLFLPIQVAPTLAVSGPCQQ